MLMIMKIVLKYVIRMCTIFPSLPRRVTLLPFIAVLIGAAALAVSGYAQPAAAYTHPNYASLEYAPSEYAHPDFAYPEDAKSASFDRALSGLDRELARAGEVDDALEARIIARSSEAGPEVGTGAGIQVGVAVKSPEAHPGIGTARNLAAVLDSSLAFARNMRMNEKIDDMLFPAPRVLVSGKVKTKPRLLISARKNPPASRLSSGGAGVAGVGTSGSCKILAPNGNAGDELGNSIFAQGPASGHTREFRAISNYHSIRQGYIRRTFA